jgi:glycine cleavage system H protein
MNVPKNLKYTREHEWVGLDGKRAKFGITDYAQGQLGDIVYVELPKVGSQVRATEPFGSIEAVKAVSDLFAPVSGVVKEVNADLSDHPEKVNRSPYGDGWMIIVEASDLKEMNSLLSAAEYESLVASEAS